MVADKRARPDRGLERGEPEQVGLSSERLALIHSVLGREVDAGRMPGAAVGIARRGKLAFLASFGYRDAAAREAMPVDAIFSIASMTKPMVSVAILQLLEEGRLLLGDPVSAYLPALAHLRVALPSGDGRLVTRPAARNPTIQDLLRHTSGLTYRDRGTSPAHRYYPGSSIWAAVRLSRDAFIEAIAQAPLLFDPGTGWEYGFSTDVLGLVVEEITGQPLGTALRERVWGPLGMTDAGFALNADTTARYAYCLANDPLTGQPQSIHHGTGQATRWDSGGGGGLGTAIDYLAFAQMLCAGGTLGGVRMLGHKTVALMTSDHLPAGLGERIADTMDPASAGYGFGLGVAVRRQTGISAMAGSAGDYYWSGVYGTYFWVDPSEQLACVFMAATPGLIRLRYRQLMRALVYQAIID